MLTKETKVDQATAGSPFMLFNTNSSAFRIYTQSDNVAIASVLVTGLAAGDEIWISTTYRVI